VNHLDALDLATLEFGRRLDLVGPNEWANSTPCTDWDVRYLVAHVVGGNRFAALVLNGETAENAVGTIMTTSQLGDDPDQDFAASATEQRREFGVAGRLEAPVDHPVGTMTAARFLSFRVFDIAVHTWDLAIGIDANPALDTDLVTAVSGIIGAEDGDMGFGIEALGLAGPKADTQDRLLDLVGRQSPPDSSTSSR